jgi:hypothetical protein
VPCILLCRQYVGGAVSIEKAQEPSQGSMQGPGPHRFRRGESGNPGGARTRRLKLQGKIDAFAAPYGGVAALAPDEVELVRQAALLATRRVSDAEQQVRVANALRSIFELLSDRHRGKNPSENLVAENTDDVVAKALRQLQALKQAPDAQ